MCSYVLVAGCGLITTKMQSSMSAITPVKSSCRVAALVIGGQKNCVKLPYQVVKWREEAGGGS